MAFTTYLIDLDGSFEQGKPDLVLTGKKAIDNQIFNLFSTTSFDGVGCGERIFEPTYGANLEHFLMEPLTESIGLRICDFVYEQVTTWLSDIIYVTRQSITYEIDYDVQGYIISIYYSYQGKIGKVSFAVTK